MKAPRRAVPWVVTAVASLLAVPAVHAGPGIVDEQVDGNVLEARIWLAGIDFADLRIEFEDVTGLEPGALGLSAERLSPLGLLALLPRLPDLLLTSIPAELPIVLHVDPGPGLEMRGTATLSLTTDLLPYLPGTRLRLFQAPLLGPFADVTAETGSGSYRVGAVRPDFGSSSYVVATDLRGDEQVSELKLDRLDARLDAHAGVIDLAVRSDLEARAAAVRAAFEDGDPDAAIEELDGLAAAVVAASGAGIPDTWEVQGAAANAAGELRSQAATLRYSLLQLAGGGLF